MAPTKSLLALLAVLVVAFGFIRRAAAVFDGANCSGGWNSATKECTGGTHACTVNPECRYITFIDSNVACSGDYACFEAKFYGSSTVTCSSAAGHSCAQASFFDTTTVNCSAFASCAFAAFSDSSSANCSAAGGFSCYQAQFSDSSSATCAGGACSQAKFRNISRAVCSADNACGGAIFSNTSSATCSGNDACKDAVFSNASSATCSFGYACNNAAFSDSTSATCSASYGCQNASFSDDSTANCSAAQACLSGSFSGTSSATCQGQDACRARFAEESSAICSSDLACEFAVFSQRSSATCSGGDRACYYTEFYDTSKAICFSDRSCQRAKWWGQSAALCSGSLACSLGMFTGTSTATCSVDGACNDGELPATFDETACCQGAYCPASVQFCPTPIGSAPSTLSVMDVVFCPLPASFYSWIDADEVERNICIGGGTCNNATSTTCFDGVCSAEGTCICNANAAGVLCEDCKEGFAMNGAISPQCVPCPGSQQNPCNENGLDDFMNFVTASTGSEANICVASGDMSEGVCECGIPNFYLSLTTGSCHYVAYDPGLPRPTPAAGHPTIWVDQENNLKVSAYIDLAATEVGQCELSKVYASFMVPAASGGYTRDPAESAALYANCVGTFALFVDGSVSSTVNAFQAAFASGILTITMAMSKAVECGFTTATLDAGAVGTS